MSLAPTADARRRAPSIPHTPPRRARSSGHPYTPGMFDALIDHPVLDHHTPAQVRGVTVELSASGRGVIVAEALHSGAGQRHLLDLAEPYSIFMRLADGREVWVEVRVVEPTPEEDREPWLDEEERHREACHTVGTLPLSKELRREIAEKADVIFDELRVDAELWAGMADQPPTELMTTTTSNLPTSTFCCPDFSPR